MPEKMNEKQAEPGKPEKQTLKQAVRAFKPSRRGSAIRKKTSDRLVDVKLDSMVAILFR